jgi:fatty-acyl-CoA synthase
VKPGKEVTSEELGALLGEHFAEWRIPDDWAFVDAIPRTSTGKFLKTKLREDFKDWVSRSP